ncbi:ferredoxin reductase [Kineococcus indalonis]|uniref:ferredoxin reductase n=1 Tax=Kineococcus indalonis TaxID=2696566 RepID=UPI0038992538
MARAEVRALNGWRPARVVQVRPESDTARTLVLEVPDWPGHLAGQHLDVRLTAPDGYRAVRSYSLASAATGPGPARVEVGVQELGEGEVSPFLVHEVRPGDVLEVTGPLGGWFVWRPGDPGPVQLVGGGSGVVPLVSVVRTHAAAGSPVPLRLLLSARTPATAMHLPELLRRGADQPGFSFEAVWTRQAPEGDRRPPARLDAARLARAVLPAEQGPTCYVCGPTAFVETVADLLLAAGHRAGRIRTERFGAAR